MTPMLCLIEANQEHTQDQILEGMVCALSIGRNTTTWTAHKDLKGGPTVLVIALDPELLDFQRVVVVSNREFTDGEKFFLRASIESRIGGMEIGGFVHNPATPGMIRDRITPQGARK